MRAIEIRPGTVKGRKITHHAIARLQQREVDPLAQNPTTPTATAARHVHGVGRRQAGRDDAPEQRQADAARLEDRVGHPLLERRGRHHRHVELGIYFYPKGQEPKFRQVLHLMGGTNGSGSGGIAIPPNTVKATEGYFLLRENGRVESFQPHMHLRGKAMAMEAILPNGQTQVLSHVANFNFNWHNTYVYKTTPRRCCRRARSSRSPRGTTTPRPRSPTPIRTCGSATAIARWTRWRTRGST